MERKFVGFEIGFILSVCFSTGKHVFDVCMDTLGGGTVAITLGGDTVVLTLGSDPVILVGVRFPDFSIFNEGIFSVRFSIFAISKSVFLIESPAFRDKTVDDGGSVKRAMISVAAWRKKVSRLISGNGICVGKKVTVSQFLSLRVLGK